MNADIFISYAREDVETAKVISDAFAHLGISCFRDEEGIPFGEPWPRTIADAISQCSALLCVISDQKSEYVKDEILWARECKKPLFPLLLRRTKLRKEVDLLTKGFQRIYVDPSLETALPEIFASLLPLVDRIKHPTAYTAYTEYTPMIDESDVRRRTKEEHHFEVDPAKDNIGRPYPNLGQGSVENGKYIFACYDGSSATHAIEALPAVTEFVFEARLRRKGGADDQWFGIEYGCKADPSGYCYQFLMNGRGELRVAKYHERGWENPIPAEKARRFRSGTPDVLKIIRNGRNVHVLGNNQVVATLVDADVRIGKIGPALGPGLTVEFSDIRVDAIPA